MKHTVRQSTYLVEASAKALDWPTASIPVVIEVVGAVDVGALERALWKLGLRHETLRCTIDRAGRHVVYDACPVQLRVTESDMEIYDWAFEEVKTPFRQDEAPLWRATLVQQAQQRFLVCTLSHLISDGPSCRVFCHQLAAMYADEVGEPLPGLPLATQYGDMADRERAVEFTQAQWWRAALDVAPLVWRRLEVDGPVVLRTRWWTAVDGGLGPLPTIAGVSPAGFMRAATALALADDVGHGDLVLSVVQSRRDATNRRTIGNLADNLPVPVNLSGRPSTGELIVRVEEATREARGHWPWAAEPIVSDAARALGRSPGSLQHAYVNYMPAARSLGWDPAGRKARFRQGPLRTERMVPELPGPTDGNALGYQLHINRQTSRLIGIEVHGPSDVFTLDELDERVHRLKETVRRMLRDLNGRES